MEELSKLWEDHNSKEAMRRLQLTTRKLAIPAMMPGAELLGGSVTSVGGGVAKTLGVASTAGVFGESTVA